ncbi:hypothetical protein [Phormidium sp. FACHB-1136]|uniref:hypothetical protein n=1 Tax=Phormidium sp. FACHB-1136 TaxID=2692848 RepID=UPI0016883EA1|nr:hypothetical protein [Phormidium sp. FACHB-1136]MBD2425244.1 hypothetical protein [Phormidium sp. FACHB-1136]
MTTPPNPTPNNQVPERIALALAKAGFTASYLADELASGSTEHQGRDPDSLMRSLNHVAECHLLEMPRSEYLANLRRWLSIFDCELLEETPMTNNPTIEPWAMNALRELVDIAALLNDEQFISHEDDPRITIIDRLTQLIQSLVIEREPLDLQGDDRRVFFVPEDGIPIEVRPQEEPDLPY